ncbi:uncharacterized protein C2orf42 homolog isoform X2 [Hypomesus transpacificus]|uniref:uncharacterized protein C2orf42 homolog isoform X2 n=1 Tax=Hypomesus transpacificus TaxID=137520 RepID=UPI001F080D93|nr:uncharacterized protein C2orf42 homolog isoform X2 [Hypomesus transpacificus]
MDSVLSVTSPPSTASPTVPTPPNLAARQRESRKNTPTTPAFLSNLGKATLRGIRKCPQCGIYNGTRGLSCKNKACGIVFKDGGCVARGRASKRAVIEVVRVVIDGGGGGGGGEEEGEEEGGEAIDSGVRVQVFSVCQRGRGSGTTQRGFVELVPTDTAIATGDGATLLTRVNLGRCFLPTCRQGQRTNQSQSQHILPNISKQGSSPDSPCAHIKQAIECQNRATPLPLKSSVLEGLPVSADTQEELWKLATESPGPLVQRVSRDTMVVKCHSGPSHPLGLLHLTVGPVGVTGPPKAQRKERPGQQQVMFHCACQGAPRGGSRSEEGTKEGHPSRCGSGATSPDHCFHFYACVCAFTSDDKLASEFAAFLDYSSNGVKSGSGGVVLCSSDKPLLQLEPITAHKTKRPRLEEPITGSSQPVDERQVTQGFQQWLASVTEKIHQTMHYQFDGKPEPLVFLIPQAFFNSLQHRLSLGSKKRRLPNATSAIVRNDSLPVGSFSKYTWHITNLMQVKRIFDTPELPLELTQSFVRNIDGSYSPFRCLEPPPDSPKGPSRMEKPHPQPIRPLELRTFLRVGVSSSAEQKEGPPFVIEWIPDILPRSRVGELRISFQYGHQNGGQPDVCDGAARGGGANKTTSATFQPNRSPAFIQVIV